MIAAVLLEAAQTSSISIISYVPAILGGGLAGSIVTFGITHWKGRIQRMRCYYVDNEIISKIPVVNEQGEHQNIHYKEFKLINTTNKDVPQFRIIFEFDAQAKILKHDTFCKVGKNYHKVKLLKPNEVSFIIKNFNRDDESKFKFDIANINQDVYNITEAECVGFKIIPKDKRKKHQKNHGKIVKKEEII